MLKCPCGLAYVRQTSRAVKVRVNEHKSNIRQYANKLISEQQSQDIKKKHKFGESSVARHFHEHQHHVSDLKWLVLEQIYEEESYIVSKKLLQRETYWIDKLETLVPNGMNEICNYNVYI